MSDIQDQESASTKSRPMLEAVGLSKSFGAHRALSSLDLRVRPGEIFCLLGPNGAGKTTTMNLFLGFVTPDSGTARVDGVVVHENADEARRRLAFTDEPGRFIASLVAPFGHSSGLRQRDG